jgi:hypothetical protein
MYKLSPTPKYTYNVAFLLEFETWWGHPEKFRTDAHATYTTMSLDAHMFHVVTGADPGFNT